MLSKTNAVLLLAALAILVLAGLQPEALPFPGAEARFSDAVVSHWPAALFLRESVLERGEFPIWRETTFAGAPFAANPLNKTAYPPQWLALIFPPALHLNLLALLHLGVAFVGMFLWARHLNLRAEAASLAAIAYTLAPRLIGHLGAGHLDVLYALAWFPWLMFSLRQVFDRGRLVDWLSLSLVTALLILADMRVSLFALLTGAVYAASLFYRHKDWAVCFLPMIGAAVLTVLLILGLMVPLLIWSPYLTRASVTAADAGGLSLQPIHLLGLLLPQHRGTVENLTYFGWPVLLLALLGLLTFSLRQRSLGLALSVLILLYALGPAGALWSVLTNIFPFLLWFRVPSRVWLILALLIPLMAGFGLHWLLGFIESHATQRFRRLNLGMMALTMLATIGGIAALTLLGLPPTVGLSTLIMGAMSGLLLLLALNQRIAKRWLAPVFLVLVVLDLGWTTLQIIEWRGPEQWLEPGRPLAERLLADNADRIYSPAYSLEQQVAAAYNLKLFGGVDPFQIQSITEAITAAGGVPLTSYSVVIPPLNVTSEAELNQANREAIIDTRLLGIWHVSHLVAPYEISHPRLELLDYINSIYIYRNLDNQDRPAADDIPGWSTDTTIQPDAATIVQMNSLTQIVALFSLIAFAGVTILWLSLFLRPRRA
ncbi:MAG: hypothetical protein J0M33_26480 [Anaerolineae bacterium]|nr:hypothetical protein [Anaerolineae bacterium]